MGVLRAGVPFLGRVSLSGRSLVSIEGIDEVDLGAGMSRWMMLGVEVVA